VAQYRKTLYFILADLQTTLRKKFVCVHNLYVHQILCCFWYGTHYYLTFSFSLIIHQIKRPKEESISELDTTQQYNKTSMYYCVTNPKCCNTAQRSWNSHTLILLAKDPRPKSHKSFSPIHNPFINIHFNVPSIYF